MFKIMWGRVSDPATEPQIGARVGGLPVRLFPFARGIRILVRETSSGKH
jgi:hypothetical protein